MAERVVLKATVDLLNSLEVQRDVISVRSKRPITSRLLAQWTGKSRNETALLHSQVLVGFEGVSQILANIRQSISGSDIVLAKAITKLKEINDSISQHARDISDIRQEIALIEIGLRELERRVEILEGQASVPVFISKLRDKLHDSDISDLVDDIDEFWWGPFGLACRQSPEKGRELLSYFVAELKELLRNRYGVAGTVPIAVAVNQIPVALECDYEKIELIAFDPTWSLRPITKAIVNRRIGRDEPDDERRLLPIVISTDRFAERIIEETIRGVPE